ncbi:hypothetical protein DNH61_12640 [Paenibacillus sambharensis]|uniref:SHOCT domain-containing protein n=1 Tax=Paenibacillus sambharensis TaxID=1803190 RepID=A0A2W1LK56_9BACL|nr:hypothetical protein [Paenibacillus sambharensis]PZD95382.1 hypothetical protein DNH61_12640 [Paenibacillus sambharensis]
MSPKRIIVVGTIAFAITISSMIGSDNANAQTAIAPQIMKQDTGDGFLRALGAADEEEVYQALYTGMSLAELAESHNSDVQELIRLQIAELTAQLDERLASGSLTLEDYQAQKAELPEIIISSVFGLNGR